MAGRGQDSAHLLIVGGHSANASLVKDPLEFVGHIIARVGQQNFVNNGTRKH